MIVPLNQLTGSNTASSIAPTTGASRDYDAAGNLTQTLGSDGSKTLYTYDDADRLTRLERRNAAGVPVSASEWVYDYASRKPISRGFTFSNGAWAQTGEKRRVFDGLDVVQERNAQNEVTAQLVRSGNIGGILSRSTGAGAAFYGYDGGGNVTLLTDSNGQEVGHYRYDAFGNTLEASGARAAENPYRFSTKEITSSGLYDYGYRFYSPSTGTWINRDPIKEDGGINVYGFVGNDPLNYLDEDGLSPLSIGGHIVGHIVTGAVLGFVAATAAIMLTVVLSDQKSTISYEQDQDPHLKRVDIYAFGNDPNHQGKPRPPRIPGFNRPEGSRPDVSIGADGKVGPTLPISGASVFRIDNPTEVSGPRYKLPANAKLPDGLGCVADGKDVGGNMPNGHSTIFPTRRMSPDEFVRLFRELDWERDGSHKPPKG